jgi:hypothetical protein
MAKIEQGFSPADVPENAYPTIPAGIYKLQVVESSIEPTKSGSGDMLVLIVEVIDGIHAGHKITDRLNIRNQNPDAQRIAQRALADLCLSLGILDLSDSEQLHFKPFTAKVRIEEDKNGRYGPQNRIRYTEARDPATLTQKAAPISPAKAKPQAAKAAPAKPWARKKEDDEIPF